MRRRRERLLHLILAGAATLALLALGPASVRLTDVAISPQAPPGLTGGSFAADDDVDQAQLQQQLNQQLQQSMQQTQEQNDDAEQQFNQDMQQQQTYENQFNNP